MTSAERVLPAKTESSNCPASSTPMMTRNARRARRALRLARETLKMSQTASICTATTSELHARGTPTDSM